MIDELSPLIGMKNYSGQIAPAVGAVSSALRGSNIASTEAQDEFLTIFYKELLKQAFKVPDLSLGEENQFMIYNSDLMVEQLARELVKSGSLRPEWVSAIGSGR